MDCEKLITLVQEQPPLWDKSHSHFKDRTVKGECWLQVAAKLEEKWQQLSPSEKTNQLAEMKNKWRNIRDNFVRSLNAGRSGAPGEKRRKYVFADSLEFIKNSLEKSSTSHNNEDTPLEVPSEFPTECPPIIKSLHSESPATLKTSRPLQKPCPMTKFQSELLKKLESSEQCHCNDPDKLYLLSLLPFYKSLSEMQKLQFQINSLNFMMSVKGGQQPQQATNDGPSTPSQQILPNHNPQLSASTLLIKPHKFQPHDQSSSSHRSSEASMTMFLSSPSSDSND